MNNGNKKSFKQPTSKIRLPPRTKWVRLKRYCHLFGDTSAAVHARRHKGVWLDGEFCKIGPDKRLWVNCDRVNKWIDSYEG